jgi:hypothetical protein
MARPRRSLLVRRSPESQRASSLCASARRIASTPDEPPLNLLKPEG